MKQYRNLLGHIECDMKGIREVYLRSKYYYYEILCGEQLWTPLLNHCRGFIRGLFDEM